MAEQVVGLRFVVEGGQEAVASIARVDKTQQSLIQTSRSLEGAIKRGSASFESAVKAYITLEKAGLSYSDVLSGLNQDLKMLGQTNQAYYNSLLGIESATKSAKDSARAMQEAFAEKANVEAANLSAAQSFGDLVREVNTYKTANKSAEDSASVFMAQIQRVEAANLSAAQSFGDLVREVNTYKTANKSAEDSASVFSSELRKQESDFSKVAKANQEYLRSLQTVNHANKSAADSASVFAKEIARQDAEVAAAAEKLVAEKLRLESMYNKTAMAARVFEQAQVSLNRALELGVIDASQHAQKLAQMKTAYSQVGQDANRAHTFINQFGEHTTIAGVKTNKFGMVAQQVGYQVGDFFVQVQSGTNAFVAFGQQATQLAGLLPGTAGAIVGIGISVGTMLLAMHDRTRQAKEGLDDLKQSLDSLTESLRTWSQEKQAATLGITVDELVAGKGIKQAEADLLAAERALAKINETMQSSYFVGIGEAAGALALGQMAGLLPNEEDVRAAELVVAEALARLQTLRQKQESERQAAFLEENRSLQQQIDLQNVIMQHGEGSLQQLKLIAAQEKANYGARVAAMDIADDQKIKLIEANNALVDMKLSQDILNDATGLLVGVWDRVISRIDAAAASARAAAAASQQIEQLRFEYSPGGQALLKYGGRGTPSSDQAQLSQKYDMFGKPIVVDSGSSKGSSGGASAAEKNYIEDLEREVQLKRDMIGVHGEQKAVMEALIKANEQYDRALTATESKRVEMAARELYRIEQEAQLRDTVNGHIKSGLMDVVQGTQSVENAFKQMLSNIILAIYEQKVAQPFANAIMAFLPFANGGAFMNGKVTPFATGGVVSSPTLFPMANGAGLMGEAGPEAIMPLKRTRGGKLGVVAEGGGGNTTVVQNFNISANGDESVKRIVQQEAPRIAEQAKAAVLDAKRRGGSYGSKF